MNVRVNFNAVLLGKIMLSMEYGCQSGNDDDDNDNDDDYYDDYNNDGDDNYIVQNFVIFFNY